MSDQNTKIIVAGGREFNNFEYLEKSIHEVLFMLDLYDSIEIVSGGARGADTLGVEFAKKHNIPYSMFPAEWDIYGDILIAFHDGLSSGTQNMIDVAKKNGLIVYVYNY